MMTKYLRTGAAAQYLGLSARTLEKLRVIGGGPAFSRPPGRHLVVYDREELDRWVASGRRRSTSEPAPTTHV